MGFLLKKMKKKRKGKDESKKLAKMVRKIAHDMDDWIKDFVDDGTPPNQEQCVELEDAKVAELIEKYNSKVAEEIGRESTGGDDVIAKKESQLRDLLEMRRGYLYRRFSGNVAALEEQAAEMLKKCIDSLTKREEEIKEMIPVKENEISDEFGEMMEDLTKWINDKYPEGVEGLDNYDDKLPDGIPSWAGFKAKVSAKEAEMKQLNVESVGPEIEEIKENTKADIKEKVNAAIRACIDDIKKDLSDDVIPFLSDEQTIELREELMASAEEYGASRIDS